jgi:hypothetical protein
MVAGSTLVSQDRRSDPGVRAAAWLAALLGLGAALIGAYLAVAPDDGTVTVFTRTWSAAQLAEAWAPRLLTIGGLWATSVLAALSIFDARRRSDRWFAAAEAVLGGVAVAAVVAGIAMMI